MADKAEMNTWRLYMTMLHSNGEVCMNWGEAYLHIQAPFVVLQIQQHTVEK